MWPFRKKAAPQAPHTGRYCFLFEQLSEADKAAISGGMPELKTYRQLKRQRAKEGKMKLEAGKYYETDKGTFQAEACYINDFRIGKYVYTDTGTAYLWGAPHILREVPAPLRLEVGKLYETTAGAQWCTHINKMYDQYKVGAHWYQKDGSLGACGDASVPRILYRIKLNEHMEPVPRYVDMVRDMCVTIPALQGVPANRFDGGINTPIPVTYKPHTDCGKREVEVPEGYEAPNAFFANENMLYPRDGYWQPMLSVPGGVYDLSLFIRPKSAPFRITWPGWYRQRNGSWVKMVDKDFPSYRMSGEARCGAGGPYDLIARATPEQARILDAL